MIIFNKAKTKLTVRVWLPENDTVYEMARMKELDPKVEFSPDYADEVSPAVVPMVNEDEVWFIQAYGGYISLFQFNGELSVKEPGTVGSCQLNRTFSIEEIYEECGYSSSKCASPVTQVIQFMRRRPINGFGRARKPEWLLLKIWMRMSLPSSISFQERPCAVSIL